MKVIPSKERQFGFILSIILLLVSLFPWLTSNGNPNKIFLIFSGAALIITAFRPIYLSTFNALWIRFGAFIGKIVNPFMILIVYLLGILPVSIILKIFHIKLLEKDIDKDTPTYWIIKKEKLGPMNNQF